jgi:hypothetical protein
VWVPLAVAAGADSLPALVKPEDMQGMESWLGVVAGRSFGEPAQGYKTDLDKVSI